MLFPSNKDILSYHPGHTTISKFNLDIMRSPSPGSTLKFCRRLQSCLPQLFFSHCRIQARMIHCTYGHNIFSLLSSGTFSRSPFLPDFAISEEYRPVILQNVSHFGFVECFVMMRFRLRSFEERPWKKCDVFSASDPEAPDVSLSEHQ